MKNAVVVTIACAAIGLLTVVGIAQGQKTVDLGVLQGLLGPTGTANVCVKRPTRLQARLSAMQEEMRRLSERCRNCLRRLRQLMQEMMDRYGPQSSPAYYLIGGGGHCEPDGL